MALLIRLRRATVWRTPPADDVYGEEPGGERRAAPIDGGGGNGGGFDDGGDDGGVDSGLGAIIWAASVALTVGLGALLVNLFRGALVILWSDLVQTRPVVPGGEDIIMLTDNGPDASGNLTISLNVPGQNVLWKAVEVYDTSGARRGDAWVMDAKKSSTLVVPSSEVVGGFVVIKKAKFLGIHTAMYVINDIPPGSGEMSSMARRNLRIDWMRAEGEFPIGP